MHRDLRWVKGRGVPVGLIAQGAVPPLRLSGLFLRLIGDQMLPFGLRLYRLLGNTQPSAPVPVWPKRPAGRLVWIHVPTPDAAPCVGPLKKALLDGGVVDNVLLTTHEREAVAEAIQIAAPSENAEQIAAFLDHWRPDAGLWLDGPLQPLLLHMTREAQVPMILAHASGTALADTPRWPRLVRNSLAAFRHLLVRDAEAEKLCLRAGVAPDALHLVGPLEERAPPLPVNEAERAALARAIGTRPAWLAAGVPEAEDDAVAAAHLSALRLAHRLLLILVPDQPHRGPELASRLRQQFGLDAVCRSREQDPVEEAQIYVADTEGEMGLWYRLAPITYLGGTLLGTGPLRHPYEAAAMGSAILHGMAGQEAPNTPLQRLQTAGASRSIPAVDDLGNAVGDLLAPDRCARLAQAAWGVVSDGGDATAFCAHLCAEMLETGAG